MNSFSSKKTLLSVLQLVIICMSFNVHAKNEGVIQGQDESLNNAVEYDPRTYIVISGVDGHLRFGSGTHRDPSSVEQDSTGFEILVGERQSGIFGFEFGFVSLGRYTINSTFGSPVKPKFFEISLLSYLPTGSNSQLYPGIRKFAAYVKTGYARCFEKELKWLGLCDRHYFNLGLGLEYQLLRNVSLRLEAQSYLQDFYTTRLGFVFRGEVVDSLVAIIGAFTSAIVYAKH